MVAEGLWQWPRGSHSGGRGCGEGEVKVVAMEAEEGLQWKPRGARVPTLEVAKEGSQWWLKRS